MPIVTTAQTLKNPDGSASEMFYGVDSPKYVRVNNEGKNLEQELDDIYQQINDLGKNINQRIDNLVNDLNAVKDKISTLEGEIPTLKDAIEGLDTRLLALENPEANV